MNVSRWKVRLFFLWECFWEKIYHWLLDNLQKPMNLKFLAQIWENRRSVLSAPEISLDAPSRIESESKYYDKMWRSERSEEVWNVVTSKARMKESIVWVVTSEDTSEKTALTPCLKVLHTETQAADCICENNQYSTSTASIHPTFTVCSSTDSLAQSFPMKTGQQRAQWHCKIWILFPAVHTFLAKCSLASSNFAIECKPFRIGKF